MIKDIIAVLFRWKWDMAVVFGLIVILTGIFALTARPVYESSATVLIIPGRERKPFLPDQSGGSQSVGLVAEDIMSEIKILTSYPVLQSVAKHLKPGDYAKKSWLRGVLEAVGLKTRIPPEERMIADIRSRLSANPGTRTATINIRYRDITPLRATEMVNRIVDAYIAHHIKVFSNSGAASAIKFMGDEFNSQLAHMEDSLKALNTRSNIVNVDLEYRDIQEKLTEARTKLLLLKRLDPEKVTAPDLANVTDDPTFAQLQTRLTDAELRYIELSSRHGRDDGKVVAAANEIREIKRFIGQRVYISIAMWNQLARKYQERFTELEQQKLGINQLEREIAGLKQAYELSNEKSNEVQINSAMDNVSFSTVRVIEYGHNSSVPVFPRKSRLLMLALFFGAMVSIAVAFIRNMMSANFFSVSEVETFAKKPVLASIPDFGSLGGPTASSAAARMLVPVVNSLKETPVVTLIVAPSRGDGASFITTAISHVLSQRLNNRVVRVDIVSEAAGPLPADKKFQISSTLTLEDVNKKIITSYHGRTDYLNCTIDANQVPEQKDIERLISLLKQCGYTHLFLDVSAHCADPLYLSFAPCASTIIPVVAYGRTKRFALMRLISLLQQYGHEIRGCVFNRRKNEIPNIIYQWL